MPHSSYVQLSLGSRSQPSAPADSIKCGTFPDETSIAQLRNILRNVMGRRTIDFSGVGLIVCNSLQRLPVFPLSKSQPSFERFDLVDQLLEIAPLSSEYHDGFHVISDAWRLTSVAQYFSPPIIVGAPLDRSKRFGGRYLAALFGSAISEVKLTGIASDGFGIAIFQRGREVVFEGQE